MNEEIITTLNEIKENKKNLKRLEEQLINQYTSYYESIGIKKGDKVKVLNFGEEDIGIFSHFYIEYSNVKAKVFKLKKDGTPYANQMIYCYDIKNIEKYNEKQKRLAVD